MLSKDDIEKKTPLRKAIPIIDPSPFQPYPNPKSRNYCQQPLVPLSNHITIWELRRPLLPKLEEVSHEYKLALAEVKENINHPDFHRTQSMSYQNHIMNIHNAKAFCISKLASFLQTTTIDDNQIQQNTDTTINNVATSILEWLTALNPVAVLQLYKRIATIIENRNGWVVSTNMTLSNATRASTNAVFLGNMQQGSTCLFYVIKYVTKNKVEIQSCLKALEQAQIHCETYESKATDRRDNPKQ
jgi:hypothetical protein